MKRNQGSGVSKFPKMPLGVRNEPQNTAKYQKNHPGLAKLPPGPRMTNLLRDDDSMSIGVKRFSITSRWPSRRQLIKSNIILTVLTMHKYTV